ncbi:uncharacterized protein B0H64DRAFT_408319 [Chaetomium fimeti]|uniref:Uncharacterized protein n=1 Tax=Chaetomium fimeti TaxID=1854472 RepID=A0AAE0H8E9_9PEZI|nr:hypothetical protein B0H64DRAFT_408319 [Chaetomium fimeti]
MAVSLLEKPPGCEWEHSEGSAVTATFPPTPSSTPKPEVALPASTHHQPESPFPSSEAPGSQQPHLAPPLHTAPPAPQPGSIQAIIREQCRSRLYVPPIVWTSKQPRLLGCRFAFKRMHTTRQGQRDAEKESATQQQTQQYQDRILAAAGLRGPAIASWWKLAIKDFLGACNIHPLGSHSTLPFRYGGHVVAKVKTEGIFSAGSTAPFLAYLNLETIDALREKHVCCRVGRRHSVPVATLRQKKLRSLQPRPKAADPYIVAALIALAQEQQLRSHQTAGGRAVDAQAQSASSKETEASSHEAAFFNVQVLAVPGARAQVLHVYKASIPSGFLDNLQKPSLFSPCSPILVSCWLVSLTEPEEVVEQISSLLRVPADARGQGPRPGRMVAYYRRMHDSNRAG